jgi:hypothetical protein
LSGPRFTRRALLFALAACGAVSPAAQPLPGSFENWRRLFGGPQAAADEAERQRLLAEGEALLAAGDAIAAQEVFQRAAMVMHAADTECSIVRAQMQAGQYRQALAFGAHAALAHRAVPGGLALYAWMLHVGGQSVIAGRLLDEALKRDGGDVALQSARDALGQPWPRPAGPMRVAPLRTAPYAHGDAAEGSGRCAGTATLLPDGTAAFVPLATVGEGRTLRLRNGLGETVGGSVVVRRPDAGVARIELARPLPVPAGVVLATRPPFAGSPAATVEFGVDEEGLPAWPVLRQGFVGRLAANGRQRLGIELPAGLRGGPVFDRAGRLAGMGLADGQGVELLWPLAAWNEGAAAGDAAAQAEASAASGAIDAVYEAALRLALQVIVDDAG